MSPYAVTLKSLIFLDIGQATTRGKLFSRRKPRTDKNRIVADFKRGDKIHYDSDRRKADFSQAFRLYIFLVKYPILKS